MASAARGDSWGRKWRFPPKGNIAPISRRSSASNEACKTVITATQMLDHHCLENGRKPKVFPVGRGGFINRPMRLDIRLGKHADAARCFQGETLWHPVVIDGMMVSIAEEPLSPSI